MGEAWVSQALSRQSHALNTLSIETTLSAAYSTAKCEMWNVTCEMRIIEEEYIRVNYSHLSNKFIINILVN
jgi:hypothetical protein